MDLGAASAVVAAFIPMQRSSRIDSLAALAPEFMAPVPLDPMNAQPLRYSRTGASATVNSVGSNLPDDRGEFVSRETEDDLAWTSMAPPPRR